jgi:hypothetical protein
MTEQRVSLRTRLENRFERFMKTHFALRLHMSLILCGTFLSGLLVSKILLMLNLKVMLLRYSLAVMVSYLVFLGLVKLWLLCVLPSRHGDESSASYLDTGWGSSGVAGDGPVVGGGGQFGGGGASGSYDDLEGGGGDTPVQGAVAASAGSFTDAGGGHEGAGSILETVGDVASGGSDDGCAWIAIVIITLFVVCAVSLFSTGIYVIVEGPHILSEAAFQFLLATGLRKKSMRIVGARGSWEGSVLRLTWKPFAIVLSLAFVFGGVVQSIYPEVTKLSELKPLYHTLFN